MGATLLQHVKEMRNPPVTLGSSKSGNSGRNVANAAQARMDLKVPRIPDFKGEAVPLAKAVPGRENLKVAEREGFETFCRLRAKSRAFADFVEC
jgi:hypothetical protein